MPSDKPKFEARKNLSEAEVAAMIRASKLKAVRRVPDPRTGDYWYWPAEMATHAWGAHYLDIPYDPYGGGQVLMLDD